MVDPQNVYLFPSPPPVLLVLLVLVLLDDILVFAPILLHVIQHAVRGAWQHGCQSLEGGFAHKVYEVDLILRHRRRALLSGARAFAIPHSNDILYGITSIITGNSN